MQRATAVACPAGCWSSREDRAAKIIRQSDMCCVSYMNSTALQEARAGRSEFWEPCVNLSHPPGAKSMLGKKQRLLFRCVP